MAQPKHRLQIMQQIEPPTDRPFRLVEVVETVDGWRSRMTNRSYTTLHEAQFMVKFLENGSVGDELSGT